jgi:hypothetical protein
MSIPDAADIVDAIENLGAGLALDPDACAGAQVWLGVVIDVITGEHLGAAVGLTMREAAGAAWAACLPVGQLVDALLGRAAPPLPDGRVRFELGPPGSWERVVSVQHAQRAAGKSP